MKNTYNKENDINNNNVEIITKKSYKWWGLLNGIILYGIPILYLAIRYSLFKKIGNWQLTPFGWIVLIIAFAFAKNQIVNFVGKFKGKFEKRLGLVILLFIIIIFLAFSTNWINHLIALMVSFVFSITLSLYPYYKYNHNLERYERLKKIGEEESDKESLRNGSIKVK